VLIMVTFLLLSPMKVWVSVIPGWNDDGELNSPAFVQTVAIRYYNYEN
jgi:hypothetical protein